MTKYRVWVEKIEGEDYKNKPVRCSSSLSVCGRTLGLVTPIQEKKNTFLCDKTLVLIEAEFEGMVKNNNDLYSLSIT